MSELVILSDSILVARADEDAVVIAVREHDFLIGEWRRRRFWVLRGGRDQEQAEKDRRGKYAHSSSGMYRDARCRMPGSQADQRDSRKANGTRIGNAKSIAGRDEASLASTRGSKLSRARGHGS